MDKIEKAKKLLQELDKATNRNHLTEAKRMFLLQEFLIDTKKRIKV